MVVSSASHIALCFGNLGAFGQCRWDCAGRVEAITYRLGPAEFVCDIFYGNWARSYGIFSIRFADDSFVLCVCCSRVGVVAEALFDAFQIRWCCWGIS